MHSLYQGCILTNDVAYDTIKNSVVDLLHYFVIKWKVFEQPVNILFAPLIINAGIILFKQKKGEKTDRTEAHPDHHKRKIQIHV